MYFRVVKKKLNNSSENVLVEVERDTVGNAAQNFRTCLEKEAAVKEEKGELSAELYKALVSSKRTSIQVDGYKFERFHQGPKDTIKVTKPK